MLRLILCLAVLASAPVAASEGAATPRELLDRMAAAFEAGDGSVVSALVDRTSPAGDTIAGAMGTLAEIFVASRELEQRAVAKFGAAGAEVIRGGGGDPARELKEAFEHAEVAVDGETARISTPGAERGLQLLRKEGRWYLDPLSMAGGGDRPAAQRLQTAEAMARTFEALLVVMQDRSLVEEATSADELKRNLASRMMAAMMAAMGAAGGAPSPP